MLSKYNPPSRYFPRLKCQAYSMLANLGCQLDYKRNQQKHKLLGTPVTVFLIKIIWSRKIHPECWLVLLMAAQRKGHRRRSMAFCLPVFTLVGNFIRPVAVAFFSLMLEPTSFACQHERRPRSLQESFRPLVPGQGNRGNQTHGLKTTEFSTSPVRGSHCWPTWTMPFI